MMRDFRQGFTFWMAGWGYLIQHRRLLLLALFPILVSFLTCIGFIWLLWSHVGLWAQQLSAWMMGSITGIWYDFVYYPMVVGGGLVMFVASVYVVFVLHSLVAVPFYSLLAERTLAHLNKRPEEMGSPFSLRLLRTSLLKSLLFLFAGILLFLFSFVPVVNLVALALTFLLLAFDCLDFAFDGMGYGFRQRFAYVMRNRAQWLGMAAGLALTLILPGLTFLVIPGAVVGAALILKENR